MRERQQALRAEIEAAQKAAGQDLHARQKDIGVLRDAANMWTNNLFEVRKQLIEKWNMDPKMIDKEFRLGDLDFVD